MSNRRMLRVVKSSLRRLKREAIVGLGPAVALWEKFVKDKYGCKVDELTPSERKRAEIEFKKQYNIKSTKAMKRKALIGGLALQKPFIDFVKDKYGCKVDELTPSERKRAEIEFKKRTKTSIRRRRG